MKSRNKQRFPVLPRRSIAITIGELFYSLCGQLFYSLCGIVWGNGRNVPPGCQILPVLERPDQCVGWYRNFVDEVFIIVISSIMKMSIKIVMDSNGLHSSTE